MATDEDWVRAIGVVPRESAATGDDHRRKLADALTAAGYPSRDSNQS